MNARLNPLAKNPPNGPITELNTDIDNECRRNGYNVKVDFPLNCTYWKIIKYSYTIWLKKKVFPRIYYHSWYYLKTLWQCILLQLEQTWWFAIHSHSSQSFTIFDRTDEIAVLAHDVGHLNSTTQYWYIIIELIFLYYLYEKYITINPSMTVEIPPPIKPSQVFFGDNFIKGVRPKKKPNIYAITSFITIILTGTMNLKAIDIID